MENRKKRRIIFLLSSLLLTSSLDAVEVNRMRYLMGTLLQIQVTAGNASAAEESIESAFEEVERWDRLLSNYKEDSEVSRMNRAYPNGLAASEEMISFLLKAQHYSEMTGGAFDLTVEPLARIWKLRERELLSLPSPREIEEAKLKVNYKNLRISPSDYTVRFLVRGMGIDTGGIGKGYALDRALEKIKQPAVESAALNFGGEVLYWSKKPQKKMIAIKNPLDPQKTVAAVHLKVSAEPAAVSTSGNYERFVTVPGTASTVQYGHILDPRTGEPVKNEVRSVTVISSSAAEADALSTAIFVMGLKAGRAFSEKLTHCGVYILYELPKGKLKNFRSKQWKKMTLRPGRNKTGARSELNARGIG